MLSAWYLNELLLMLLPKEDPYPQLFATYEETLGALCQAPESVAPILRRFEWILLQETGYGFDGEQPTLEAFRTDPTLRQALRARIDHLIGRPLDRKSTRLNSSHVAISYAVFCLKKKKNADSV